MTEIFFYAFFISIVIQAFYFIFLFSKLIFFKDSFSSSDDNPSVSVIIAAHNELNNLKRLIPSLLQQKYSDFEIILVDDRSEDRINEFVKENFNNSILKFIRIEKTPEGINPKKHALTQGILSSQKEIILLTDADCMPTSNQWIKEMVQPFKTGDDIVLGYSPYEKKVGLLNLLIRYETFYTGVQYLSFALARMPYMGVGRNLAYRKKLFLENNGYKAHQHIMGGDDDLLIQEIGKKGKLSIRIKPESQMLSIPKEHYFQWFKQKKRHLSVGKYYNFIEKISLGLLSIAQIWFYLAFFYLFFTFKINNEIIIGLIVRTLLIIAIFTLISRNLKDDFKWYYFPLLDFLNVLNYITVGIAAIISKNTKWI